MMQYYREIYNPACQKTWHAGRVARKPARRGSKAANKGAYTDVSDRYLQLQLTTQAKILAILELFF